MDKEELFTLLWEKKPDFDYIRGGRVRVTVKCPSQIKLFRLQMDAIVPVQNIYNAGSCSVILAACTAELEEINAVIVRPQERVSVFIPDERTAYLIVSCNGEPLCQGTGILECDDIPRV